MSTSSSTTSSTNANSKPFHSTLFGLPQRNECFVGREAFLKHLCQSLTNHHVVQLVGPSGVGKS
ncbi:MAG: hypothetical protein WCP39_01845, partial [Chlamydiota bacterium]